MKIFKLLLVAALPVLLAVESIAQGKIEITSSKQTFTQSETGSVTLFTYSGTAEEVKTLKEKAAGLKERLSLEMTKNAQGNYDCRLVVTQQNHAEYVAKMLLTLGFEKVFIDGSEKPVQDLAEDLKTMSK